VKASFVLESIKNSRSKKAIFLNPKGSRIKIVQFTHPSKNAQEFEKLKNYEGEEIVVKGTLISHPQYGIEIIVERIER
jgi:hypothetical protein